MKKTFPVQPAKTHTSERYSRMALGADVCEVNAKVVGPDTERASGSPEPGQETEEIQKFPTRGTEDSHCSEY